MRLIVDPPGLRSQKIDRLKQIALNCNADDPNQAIDWLARDWERQKLEREDLRKQWLAWFERWWANNHPKLDRSLALDKFKAGVKRPPQSNTANMNRIKRAIERLESTKAQSSAKE